MLNRGIAVALALLLPLAAHSQAFSDTASAARAEADYQPVTKQDAFNGLKLTSLDTQLYSQQGQNDAISCSSYEYVTLTLIRAVFPGKPAINLIQVTYKGDSWIFMSPAEPLRVLVGSTVHSFPKFALPTREIKDSGVEEVNSFKVTSAELAWLASQPSAKVRVTGSKADCDFELSPEALALTGMFNNRVVREVMTRTASR